MAFSRYNKDRPFLIVTRISTPAEGEKTSKKNWGKDGKWNQLESISIVDSLTTNHMSQSFVIIDILKRLVVKSRFAEIDNKEVLEHYLKQYKNQIAEGIQIWMKKNSSNKEDAEKFIKSIEDEMNALEKITVPVSME